MLASAGTPKAVISQLNAALLHILRNPDVRSALLLQGAEPVVDTPEQFGAYIHLEITKWADVIKISGTTAASVGRKAAEVEV